MYHTGHLRIHANHTNISIHNVNEDIEEDMCIMLRNHIVVPAISRLHQKPEKIHFDLYPMNNEMYC